MSEQRKSLLRSSISINSIRRSATQFSKSLQRSNVIASEIAKTTRRSNVFNEKMISKENEYFRKRRENVRRKQREDELEASTITGATKKEGNIVQRSTRGFLGRILDFFGIILIGWFVTKLPEIIKAIRKVIDFIRKAVRFLTVFLDGIKNILTGIGDGIKAAIDSFPKFDFLNFKRESDKTLKDTENRARDLTKEFQRGFLDFGRDIASSTSDVPGVVEGGEVIIPNEDQVGEGMVSEDGTNEGDESEDDTSDKNQITAFRPDDEQDEKLRLEENQGEEELIANLDKLNKSSTRLKNVYDDKKNKVTSEVEKGSAVFGPGGGGGSGSGGAQSSGGGITGGTGTSSSGIEAGAFTEATDEDIKREKNLDSDDSTSMGTPQAGDYYVTKGGQGNKQSFYHVLQPNGKIKSIGKRRPDGGSKFTRSEIVAVGNNIKAQNIKGVPSDDRPEIMSLKIHNEGENNNNFVDSMGKMQYNLEEIFKKDRPTIIFKEIGFNNPNIQMPSFTSGGKINFDFKKQDDSLKKIHSLILDTI